MAAYVKLGDIKGQSEDGEHPEWVMIDSMSAPIFREIPAGVQANQRSQGDTTLGDVVFVRSVDKSSVKIQEACANGTILPEVIIHFCAQAENKQTVYLEYKLHNVIISSYSFHGTASGSPLPSEEMTCSYTKVEWTYNILDPEDFSNKGKVAANFDQATNQS